MVPRVVELEGPTSGSASSFDGLVRPQQQGRRDRKAERLAVLKITVQSRFATPCQALQNSDNGSRATLQNGCLGHGPIGLSSGNFRNRHSSCPEPVGMRCDVAEELERHET